MLTVRHTRTLSTIAAAAARPQSRSPIAQTALSPALSDDANRQYLSIRCSNQSSQPLETLPRAAPNHPTIKAPEQSHYEDKPCTHMYSMDAFALP